MFKLPAAFGAAFLLLACGAVAAAISIGGTRDSDARQHATLPLYTIDAKDDA